MQMIPLILQGCNHLVSNSGMATQQVNVRMEDDFVVDLKDDATKYKFRSHNEVARDILETYHEMWRELQEAKLAFLEQQKKRIVASEKQRAG